MSSYAEQREQFGEFRTSFSAGLILSYLVLVAASNAFINVVRQHELNDNLFLSGVLCVYLLAFVSARVFWRSSRAVVGYWSAVALSVPTLFYLTLAKLIGS